MTTKLSVRGDTGVFYVQVEGTDDVLTVNKAETAYGAAHIIAGWLRDLAERDALAAYMAPETLPETLPEPKDEDVPPAGATKRQKKAGP